MEERLIAYVNLNVVGYVLEKDISLKITKRAAVRKNKVISTAEKSYYKSYFLVVHFKLLMANSNSYIVVRRGNEV